MTEGPFRATADGVVVAVRLTPKAARAGIEGVRMEADGAAYLAVRVTEPAEGGKANTALARLLARAAGVPASRVTLVSGAAGRRKRLHLAGRPDAVIAALGRTLSRDDA